VVVASVFAFAVLSTGLLSSEKSKETVLGGLAETSSTISIRGSVIGDANSAKTFMDTVKFTLSSAAQAADAVDLSPTGVVVTYLDQGQAINCQNPQAFDGDVDTAECSWSTNWVIGSGDLVDPGEQVDMTVTLTNLSPLLPTSREFTIQVKPNTGAVAIMELN
jgi:archaellin